ncbi:MAG: DUF427 domain-containing protein [Burkholderiales bacterium]
MPPVPNPAPGFQKVPRSHIVIRPLGRRVRVTSGGSILADSRAALELKEGSYAPVLYLPRADVSMAQLERTAHRSYCPFKGEASYFSIAGGAPNAAWSYEQPYDEMLEIREMLAFYPGKVDAISVE